MEDGGCSQLKGVFSGRVWRGRWEHGRGLRTTLRYDGGGWWFIRATITFLLLYTRNEVESITLTPDQRNKPHTHTATIQSLEHVHFVHLWVAVKLHFHCLCHLCLSSGRVWTGRWEHGRGLRTTLIYDGGWWWFIQAFLSFLLLLYTRHEVERITLMLDLRNKPHTHSYHPITRTCPLCAPVGGSPALLPLCLPPLSSLSCVLVPPPLLLLPLTSASWGGLVLLCTPRNRHKSMQ